MEPILNFKNKDKLLISDTTVKNGEDVFVEVDSNEAKEFFNVELKNFRRFSSDGEDCVEDFNKEDNLLIKGNNLLALHSLLPKYAGEVKCMYWDILYNTQNKNLSYNDCFDHNTWLVMMKNRLEVARELLKDTGCIFIHLDDTELAYLKVLCDELFGRENFITMITCKVKAPSGVAAGSKMFFDVSEYILCYAKDKKLLNFNTVKVETEVVSTISKTASQYKYLLESVDFSKKEQISTIGDVSVFKIPKEYISISQIDTKKAENSFFFENIENIFATASLSGGTEKKVKSFLDSLDDYDSESLYSYTLTPKKGKNKGSLVENLIFKKRGMLFLKDYSVLDSNKKEVIKLDYLTNIISNDLWQGIASEGSVTLKNGKKPENLIKTLLEVATNEGDLVLDAYLGSGTTAAVAHKMGRRYIGIEQMDSSFEMSKQRLSGVIDGDSTGVSKALNWKGGGSFVSCEVLNKNH